VAMSFSGIWQVRSSCNVAGDGGYYASGSRRQQQPCILGDIL
jgi:hypothetical protein